jgi:hypothetical protein
VLPALARSLRALKNPLHLHGTPVAIAPRRGDTFCVEAVCDGLQARCAGRLVLLPRRPIQPVPKWALERLLGDAAGRLADEIGDGVWRNELDPGEDQEEVAAGLIWFCLGLPEALSRWRAAHVVRTCARMGRSSLIAKLFNRLGASGGGAFQDQTIPFMVLHAKFWFLLAVARIALDFPREIAEFVGPLQVIALDDSFPHVGLRQLAVTALKTCLGARKDSEAKAILKRVASVHVSKFPRPKKTEYVSGQMWNRPKDVPEPDPDFHFDYDFEKHAVTGLGRLFAMPQWQTGDSLHRLDQETVAERNIPV